jgi:tRNA modification GTPase
MNTNDTICALSTPPGSGAISIVRISGDKAIQICSTLLSFSDIKKNLLNVRANTVHVGVFHLDNSPIDDVVSTVFRAPNSYTGENIVELSCHGSPFIQQKILEVLVASGARLARPGEFTQRAFLNGKMDLSQAEGVADLIASGSAAAHRLAFQQMRGGFSAEIKKLRNELLQFISLVELELDFSEEDVEFANRNRLSELVKRIHHLVTDLIRSFEYGNVIKNGIPVAIIGRTNSGKSTLLNRILKEEKAIVSDIAGTTRDFIEDTVILQGIQFRFIDTAGLRHVTDQIESEGIRRTFNKYEQASIILVMVDLQDNLDNVTKSLSFLREGTTNLSKKTIVFLLNKLDIVADKDLHKVISDYIQLWGDIAQILAISAKNGDGIDELEKLLVARALKNSPSDSEVVVTNVRHFEALRHTSEALERIEKGLETSFPTDLLAQDIREALHYLGEITGEITTDEILGNLFKNFCIGK